MSTENDGKNDGFDAAMDAHQEAYGSVMSIIEEKYDVIEKSLSRNVPLDVITEELNNRLGLKTNKANVKKCLQRIRDREASGVTGRRKRSNLSKVDSATKGSPPISEPEHIADPTCPRILKLEEIIGERAPESVRPFISVNDNGGIRTHFKKGTRHTTEMRQFLQRCYLAANNNKLV